MAATKYDWDSAWHLYMAGATCEETAEMLNIPFKTVVLHVAGKEWAKRRATARQFAQKAIEQDLNRKLERARVTHQNFMIDQLSHTQTHIEQIDIGTDKDKGEVHVMDKLAVMTAQHNLAAKVLKLDEEKPKDPVEMGFALLVAMGRTNLVNESQRALEPAETYDLQGNEFSIEIQPKTPVPLPSPSEAPSDPLAGILRPFNGHSNGMQEPPNQPNQPITGEPGIETRPNPAYDKATHEYDPETGHFIPRKPSGYQAPKPLVNENQHDDNTTDSTGDQRPPSQGRPDQSKDNPSDSQPD